MEIYKGHIVMKKKHKELLCLATAYLDLYISEYQTNHNEDIEKLYNLLRVETYNKHSNKQEALDNSQKICNRLQLATNGVETEVNIIAIAINCVMLLIEDDYFTGTTKYLVINQLVNRINRTVEGLGDKSVMNSMKLIAKLRDRYE
jgi:hypothetical protein